MTMNRKVVLGLSGGVDSAVAARLLLEQGYEVYPLWLDVGTGAGEADAQAVAKQLGLSFRGETIASQLEEHVCRYFTQRYLSGMTPLPCAVCNPTVKFPALLAYADQIGAEWVATGHYARVKDGVLYKGMAGNDQSYLLSRLPRSILQRVIFPLGNYEKPQVRQMAEGETLPVAHKPDSMEICFIPDGDYAGWLDRRGETPPPGNFVDETGKVLGQHKGIHHYTLGQRKKLGVAAGERVYVARIDPEKNEVQLVHGDGSLYASQVTCQDPNWIAIETLTAPMEVTVRLRHSRTELPGIITPTKTGVEITLQQPGRAPTPGQLAVFYQGDAVVGSGWIV
jgi:tRNA-specific 2-thiouridylase